MSDKLDELIPKIGTIEEFETDSEFKPSKVGNYCKDCKKLVEVIPRRKKSICKECKGKNVAMGTEKSLRNYYKISD